ncbi:MAG TPA: MFS transporter [Candidatus Limnocylindria bacterium]|nr:MFS transporter [Candidatus Limnocylindria bacterium]
MRRGPLRHKWFAAFTAAIGLGSVADEVARLALPLLILDLTHSIAAAATLRVVQSVPYILFGAPAGALIDRVDKRRLLIACDVAGIALTAAIPLSAVGGVFSVELLYVIGFLLGTVEVLWGVTTDFSVVPSLVEERELTEANAIFFAADRAARIVGPTLGGLAIAAIGGVNTMWIAALAFLPTLALFYRMPPILEIASSQHAPLTVRNVMKEIGDGFAFVWRLEVLRWLLLAMSIANLGGIGLRVLVLYVLREEHRLDEVSIGIALSVSGGLTILGSLLAPRLARGRPMGHSMIAVILASGLAALAAAFAGDWRLITLCFTGREIAWQAFIIYAFIPRQRDVPAHLRGRANGAFRTVVLISNSASPAVLSAIVVAASSAVAFAVAGLLAIASAGIAALTPLRDYAVREPAADDVAGRVAAERDVTATVE